MAHIFSNPNPQNSLVGDCVIRALAIAMGKTWQDIYIKLTLQGLVMSDMPSSNKVWGSFLMSQGWKKHTIPDTCPQCYTIKDFCGEHFKGTYIACSGTHVVACIDGNYYDTWDSGDETVLFYFEEEAKDE